MSREIFSAVDDYLDGLFDTTDEALDRTLERSREAGLPPIHVSATLGRFLHVLALAVAARTILEIGTLGGYSAIWLARALPADGRLVTLERDPVHAAVARDNLRDVGLGGRVEVRVGDALDLLDELVDEDLAPFDLVFIDADKPPYADYLDAAIGLSRVGTLIVADNVVRGGRVLDPDGDDAAHGVARFNARLANDPRVSAAVVQQVGSKGHDGMAFAVVREAADLDRDGPRQPDETQEEGQR